MRAAGMLVVVIFGVGALGGVASGQGAVDESQVPLSATECDALVRAVVEAGRFTSEEMAGYCEDALPTMQMREGVERGYEFTREEIESYAVTFGISLEDAEQRLNEQMLSSKTAGMMRLAAGERLVSSRVTHDDGVGIEIRVTAGPEISELSRLAASSAHPIDLAYVEQSSHYSRVDAIDSIIEALGDLNSEVFQIRADEYEHVVQILVDEQSQRLDEVVSTMHSARGVADVAFEVIPVDDPGMVPENRGGRLLTTCTSGFNVQAGSQRYMTTAAHCGNTQRYFWFTEPSHPGFPMTFIRQSAGPYSDIQIHTTESILEPRFYAGDSTIYPGSPGIPTTGIAYRANMPGTQACHRGRSTGASCGFVTSITEPWHGQPPPAGTTGHKCSVMNCASVWVKYEGAGYRSWEGDSGGVVYSGGIQYGLHTGGSGSLVPRRSGWFMSIGFISYVGVSALTY